MPTHFFHSGMTGAPTNTNAAGSTLEIIRSCLVTGFNVKTVLSATVASGVMTLSYSTPHGYEDKVWIRLDGAAGGSIVRRATVTGASALTIAAAEFVDGAVAGTLSTRVAPADWEEVFTGTLKAVFRSKVEGPGSTRFFYRVSDAVSGSQRMFRGFESMSDVDTGIGLFPTVAQESGEGLNILRADGATARPWCVIADGRTFYVFLGYNSAPLGAARAWGDMTPYGPSDLFCAFTLGGSSSYGYLANSNNAHYVPRVAAGTGAAQTGTRRSIFTLSGEIHAYPSPIDGGMVFYRPVLVNEGAAIRGEVRGLISCSAPPIPSGQLFTIMQSVPGVVGRLCVVRDSGGAGGCVAFPIDEDWA